MTGRESCTSSPISFCEAFVIRGDGEKSVILRKRIPGLSSSALEGFVARARRALRFRGAVNVLVTSSSELRALNRRFRQVDKPTDVLSFLSPSLQGSRARQAVGDIAVSADIARKNAERLGHSVANEIKILVLHGILHIAGYDHEGDNGRMERKEKRLRLQLKLESSLIERARTNGRLRRTTS